MAAGTLMVDLIGCSIFFDNPNQQRPQRERVKQNSRAPFGTRLLLIA
jgi:hypothetical protein